MARGSARMLATLFVLSTALWSVSSAPLPTRVSVSGSKGRVLAINANEFYPDHCIAASGQQGYPLCLIVLSTEPRHGDLFADRVSGTELHVAGAGNTDSSSCKSNRWVYAEETYVDTNPSDASSSDQDRSDSGDDSDERDLNESRRRCRAQSSWNDDGALAKYRGGSEFDSFIVQLFSPVDSESPLVTTTVVINMINHRPVAVSSTMVLRARDPWTDVSNTIKTFSFPRYVMLQGFDPDTSDQNPDELLSVCNISFVDVQPDSVRVNFADSSASPLPGDEASRDEDLAFLSVSGFGPKSASFAIRFAQKDVEGAVSLDAAKTYVTVVPEQDSLLPDARMRMSSPPSFAVLRAFGVPTLVLCKYLREGNSVSDCRFRLLGGDHLSLQVSMSAVQPHGDPDDNFIRDVRALINASLVLSSDVDTEGSFRLGRYDEGSAQQDGEGYYPGDPETVEVNPLFSAKFVLSDITTNSPPDVISTSFKTVIQEHPRPTTTASGTTVAANTVTSPEVAVKLFSQYVPTPPLVCSNVSFSWTDLYVEPPASCGHSSEYDTECTALLGRPDESQQVALLPAFQVFFESPALQDYVWLKDLEAVFAVVGITEDADSGSPLGCMYHRLLFRPVVVGDILESEADLMWMPFANEQESGSADGKKYVAVCDKAHRSITLRLVVGGQSACQFSVSAPVGSRPSADKQYLHRAVMLQVPFDSSILSQNDDYNGGGAVVIPFSVHRAVDKLAALDGSGASEASNSYRVLSLIPNVAQHAVMTSYSNGPVTYPSTVVTALTQLFVPRRPFGSDAPSDLDGQEIGATSSKVWVSDFRRSLTAVVTAGNDALVHRHRRVTFYANPLPSAAATAPRQYQHNLVYVHMHRDRSSPLSISRAAAQCGYAEDVDGLRDAASTFGFSLTHSVGVTLDRSPAAKALIERGPLHAAMRRAVAEVYDVEVLADAPTTLWFSSFDDDAGQQRLAVTRFPKLVKASASYASSDQAPSFLSALTDVGNAQFADSFADVDGCAALQLTVAASPEVIQATPGESPNFADDLLGVAFTDGVSTSHEVILVLHIRKSLNPGSTPAEFAAEAAAVTSLDRLILVLSLVSLFTAIVVYRRELRRLLRRSEIASGDSEDPDHHHQQQQRHASADARGGIGGWAPAVASRIKTLFGSKTRKFALVPTTVGGEGEEEDDEMNEGISRLPPLRRAALGTAAAIRVAPENGDDDDFEEGCKPHPSVITVSSPSLPQLHQTPAPAPPVVVHGQPAPLPAADSAPAVKPPDPPLQRSGPKKHLGKKD